MKRRRFRSTGVFGVLLLAHLSAFSPSLLAPRRCISVQRASARLLNAVENDAEDESNENINSSENILSQVKRLGRKGGSDVMSVASAAGSGIHFAAGATGSGIKSVVGAASSGISKIASKGGSDAKNVAKTVGSGIQTIAGGVSQLSGKTSQSIAGAAESGIKAVASTTASGLSGLAQKGGSDTVTLMQWLDAQAKETAISTKDTAIAATRQAKAVAKKLMDLTTSTDYNLSDILFMLKVLLVIGASFGPLAKVLPVTVLLQMLNTSLEARLGGKILEVLAESLDERFTAAISAEELGDLAKRSLTGAILAFTGKESYETGDIECAVKNDFKDCSEDSAVQRVLELSVGPEFAQWDEAFRESHPNVELIIAESVDAKQNDSAASPKPLDKTAISELEEWDRLFLKHLYEYYLFAILCVIYRLYAYFSAPSNIIP